MFRIKENKRSSKTNVQQIDPPWDLHIKNKQNPNRLTTTPKPINPIKIFLDGLKRQRHVLR